jgi:hypothetical protein
MTEKVDQLLKDLGPITNTDVQKKVRGILWTRIAAGIEKREKDWEKTGFTTTSPAWVEADKALHSLAKENPEEAMSLAIKLILKSSSNPGNETVDKWLAVSGLSILGFDEMTTTLDTYLTKGFHRTALYQILAGNIQNDVSAFTTKKAFHNPRGFMAVQSVYIGRGLKGAKSEFGQMLSSLAEFRKNSPDIKKAAHILISEDGCEYLAARL